MISGYARSCACNTRIPNNRGPLKIVNKTWSDYDKVTLKKTNKKCIWMAERPFYWNGLDVGSRMAVIQLGDGSLWVHSPLALDQQLSEELEKIGPVKHIVSPNYEHVKYAGQWMQSYPQAKGYACPGLMEKLPELPFAQEVTNDPPKEWLGEIDCVFLDYEYNPFTRKPFFNEVVFVHRPSCTLIVSDLYWNYPVDLTGGEWFWKQGMDRLYGPFYKQFMIKNTDIYDSKIAELMQLEWDCIVPCHGDLVETDAKQVLEKFLQ
eukprot:TRINITY_DN6824_c0_g1_i2.p1 TRINITY_DN6824_c0_g1~~TRINITY_DN6824_c0_g1_i2.p1  ORF type:complete len:294 (-),score=16.28 TRINITY_DN6824_c0_g1_i2:69-857(-)